MRSQFTIANRRGVTMVEVLVAAALSVALISLFVTVVTTATGSVSTAKGLGEIDAKVRNVTTLLRDDLNHVFLGGTSLANIFANSAPDQGYFTIEENSPACPINDSSTDTLLRQGVDQRGIPVEIDTDDVLAFTVRRNGDSIQEIYTGRVPTGDPTITPNLDTIGAKSRFDDILPNGVFTSRLAEVCYFLRPNGRQPSLTDLTPNTAPGTTAIPAAPFTYTLYRRQLLVLEEAYANGAYGLNKIAYTPAIHDAQDFFNKYDISASWDPNPSVGAPARMHFNTMTDLADRRYRFGLYSSVAIPSSGTSYATATRWMPFAAFPSATGGPDTINNRIHDYGTFTSANTEQWFGRPTLAETSSPSYRLDTLYTGTAISDAGDGTIAAFPNAPNLNRRRGEDVLLTNVVSFDVKVFDDEDSYFFPGVTSLAPWPRGATSLVTTPPLAPTAPVNLLQATGTPGIADEFIDLGFRGQPELVVTWNTTTAATNSWASVLSMFPKHIPARWRSQGQNGVGFGSSATGSFPVSTYDTWTNNVVAYPILSTATDVAPPPYARPLKAIQIKLRVLEPKTNIVREATVIHAFQ